ncbi:hypothetical protein D3C87_101830 [compost metagenome]
MDKIPSQTINTPEDEISLQEEKVRLEMQKLFEMHRNRPVSKVLNYNFTTEMGVTKLTDLFNGHNELIVVHNVGVNSNHCTLWADGFSGLFEHFENRAGFVVISNDTPEEQQQMARARGWKFPMASAQATSFSHDMNFLGPQGTEDFLPGVSIFTKDSQGHIHLRTRVELKPGDVFCSLWNLFSLLPTAEKTWRPKYNYLVH